MSRREKKDIETKNKKKIFILIAIIFLIIAIGGVVVGVKFLNNDKVQNQMTVANTVEESNTEDNSIPEEKTVKIFSGNQRPVAVMIDNHKDAWPQSSINDAYMVYEIIVEGSETRLMALFKGKDVDNIGPVRSSRHYFLDYALENDAIYAHIGWSPQAEKDIKSLKVNNVNGLYYDSGKARTDSAIYWRSSSKSAPHNCFTSIKGLYEVAKELGYSTTSNKKSVLNYVTDEVELESDITAETVNIPFSKLQTVKFVYNPETKRYTRYARGSVQKDANTSEEITTKNIIITFAKNYSLNDGENKGRQGLKNIGTLDGYYITNGKAIKITCEKSSRTEQTVYKDLNGNEISVNDGNTFVEICPTTANVTFE